MLFQRTLASRQNKPLCASPALLYLLSPPCSFPQQKYLPHLCLVLVHQPIDPPVMAGYVSKKNQSAVLVVPPPPPPTVPTNSTGGGFKHCGITVRLDEWPASMMYVLGTKSKGACDAGPSTDQSLKSRTQIQFQSQAPRTTRSRMRVLCSINHIYKPP